MRRRAFRIAYDGRPFSGYQRQPDVPTVEDTIFDALDALDIADLDRRSDGSRPRPDGYAAAGRTDAGVSAAAQTIALDTPDWLTPRALNSQLPASVRAWAATDTYPGFHATHDATERTYRYYLYAPTANQRSERSHTPSTPAIDDATVQTALDRLSGDHDVHNLTPDTDGTRRSVTATAVRDDDRLVIEVAAGGFPREFIRRLITLVRAIGAGDTPLSTIDRVLSSEALSGPDGFGPAPATPLVLWDVAYDRKARRQDDDAPATIRFDCDEDALDSTRAAFEARYIDASNAATAAGAVRDRVTLDRVTRSR